MLHNDWEHLMPRVVWGLEQAIPGTGLKRATPITYEAHPNGRAVAKRCHKELAELYKKRLQGGPAASLKPARQRDNVSSLKGYRSA